MSSTNVSYTGDGVTVLYTITFPYLKKSHVKATINGSGTSAFSFANDTTVQFDTAPANGAEILLYRDTPADVVDSTFFPNSSIKSDALNDNFRQTLYVSEEARNAAADAQLGDLVPGSIGTEELADGAVINEKLADGSVTTDKLDANGLDPVLTSINGGPLAGFRNILINGAVTINQRGLTYASVAVGEYWADRWKKTAGGMTQIIEAGSFTPGATYTLSGNGVTTQQLTAPASGNWTLPNIPNTATDIQLELGSVATPFERRPVGVELALCQRYYHTGSIYGSGYATGAGSVRLGMAYYPVTMRATPTVTFITATGVNITGQAAAQILPNSFGLFSTALGAGSCSWSGTYSVDAEL